jgi:hypothetical protein
MSFFLPPGDEGPLALYTPGALENLMEQAGIRLIDSGEVDCPFEWSDDETAWQALHSPGPMVAASASVGEETLRTAVLASLQPFKQPSGSYRQENVFRYVIGQV